MEDSGFRVQDSEISAADPWPLNPAHSVEVLTFGCRLNAFESEVMRGHLHAAQASNTILFNSCAVTAEAERQLRQSIRKTRRERPDATIIVTGCAAQINPAAYAAMPEVDRVIGNAEKMEARTYQTPDFGVGTHEKIRVNDIFSVKETASHLIQGMEGRARAFVQIQNGCNHRCTFCIIPYGRGNSRSVPAGEVVTQIRLLVEQGYREVVLTGVDIGDYGTDLPGSPSLGDLVARILKLVPELPRLRLSSLDAIEVDDILLRCFTEEPRLMPHLHLSVQAGDDMILKRMKRRHLRADVVAICDQLRTLRPEMVFGADLIAGFPTETDSMFENTQRLIRDAGLTYLHVFPYSARTGTPAAKMPRVPKPIRKERAERLRQEGERMLGLYLASRVGCEEDVLVETPHLGRTTGFAEVRLASPHEPGSLHRMVMQGVAEGKLRANQL
jgi:threonylcarbamoyladenosine tRNA methylthiotransferase MtaB